MADKVAGWADAGLNAVSRARALMGVPFCLHGRSEDGLDCVGLAALAHGINALPDDYGLRNTDLPRWTALLDQLMEPGLGCPRPGDVLLMRIGSAQLHLGIWSGTGLIHAHAGLRRVVETPGQPDWPLIGHWQRRKDTPWQR